MVPPADAGIAIPRAAMLATTAENNFFQFNMILSLIGLMLRTKRFRKMR
jgi:hypothetical protein